MKSDESRPSHVSGEARFDARWWAVAMVWSIVALRVAAELVGHGHHLWHHDLNLLFREEGSFYRGVYPAIEVAGGDMTEAVRSDYPPFSFVLMMPWVPPGLGWRATEVWFVTCQLAATLLLAGVAYRRGRAVGRGAGWLLAGSLLALTGLRADWLFGNLATLMTAVLVLMLLAVERGRWGWAGAAWVASVLKPQMGWLFGWFFIARGRWRVVLAVSTTLAMMSLAACWWTGVSPVDVVRSAYSDRVTTMALQAERHNLVSLLGQFGMSSDTAVIVAALAGVLAAALGLRYRFSGSEVLTQFAFVGAVNRICTYHNACDDLLLGFALLVIGRHAWRTRAGEAWGMFFLLGGSVWTPTRAWQWPGANATIVGIWIVVAGWLWLRARELQSAGEESSATNMRQARADRRE